MNTIDNYISKRIKSLHFSCKVSHSFESLQQLLTEAGFYSDRLFTTLFIRYCTTQNSIHSYIVKFDYKNLIRLAVKEYRRCKFKRNRKTKKFDNFEIIEDVEILTPEIKIKEAIELLKENGYRIYKEEIRLVEI